MGLEQQIPQRGHQRFQCLRRFHKDSLRSQHPQITGLLSHRDRRVQAGRQASQRQNAIVGQVELQPRLGVNRRDVSLAQPQAVQAQGDVPGVIAELIPGAGFVSRLRLRGFPSRGRKGLEKSCAATEPGSGVDKKVVYVLCAHASVWIETGLPLD